LLIQPNKTRLHPVIDNSENRPIPWSHVGVDAKVSITTPSIYNHKWFDQFFYTCNSTLSLRAFKYHLFQLDYIEHP
jgi:hypothetical protein